MIPHKATKPAVLGAVAALTLLAVYFSIVSLVSGWEFAQDQFRQFWYFVVSLAAGFGIQTGLYSYLRREIHAMHPAPFGKQPPSHTSSGSMCSTSDGRYGAGTKAPGRTVAVTGTTSTLAMISCCAHYLANIVPILGIAGALSIVGQYQKELFWVGLAFNLAGMVYIGNRVIRFRKLKYA